MKISGAGIGDFAIGAPVIPAVSKARNTRREGCGGTGHRLNAQSFRNWPLLRCP